MLVKELSKNICGLYKPAGWTPLQALDELRLTMPELQVAPLTYAGRLDPMAEGLLLVLAGDAVHEKDNYLKLDKTYMVTALLGFETDSFDLLGIPCSAPIYRPSMQESINRHATEILNSYVGKISLPLPRYSSPPHKGKPLFWWARQKLLGKTEAPVRETTIYSITDISINAILASELLTYIETTIPKVNGDFRQTEIISAWKKVLNDGDGFQTITFTVSCSSGTYIRSLVHDLGTKLGIGACVFKLVRTRVGEFTM